MGDLEQSYRMADSLLLHAQMGAKICLPASDIDLVFFAGLRYCLDRRSIHRELSDHQGRPIQSGGIAEV